MSEPRKSRPDILHARVQGEIWNQTTEPHHRDAKVYVSRVADAGAVAQFQVKDMDSGRLRVEFTVGSDEAQQIADVLTGKVNDENRRYPGRLTR